MLLDFIQLWAVALNITKAGLRGHVGVETAAVLVLVAAAVIALDAVMGSDVFRRRLRVPQFLLSLGLLAWSVADGDLATAVNAAILTSALPIAGFGLYLMIRSAFGKM